MIPGAPRNQREMQMMMRRLGMSTEPIDNVEEVVIRTKTKEHVFEKPEVTILTIQGVKTYQVVGKVTVRTPSARKAEVVPTETAAPAEPSGPPEEDIQLVMDQAHVSHEEAVDALLAVNGAPAEAILRILSRRGPE